MKRLFLNLFAFVSALAFVLIIFYFNKNNIFDYYFNSLESLKKTHSLKNDLESGKIVVFGSSELDYKNQKFTPLNFFLIYKFHLEFKVMKDIKNLLLCHN